MSSSSSSVTKCFRLNWWKISFVESSLPIVPNWLFCSNINPCLSIDSAKTTRYSFGVQELGIMTETSKIFFDVSPVFPEKNFNSISLIPESLQSFVEMIQCDAIVFTFINCFKSGRPMVFVSEFRIRFRWLTRGTAESKHKIPRCWLGLDGVSWLNCINPGRFARGSLMEDWGSIFQCAPLCS